MATSSDAPDEQALLRKRVSLFKDLEEQIEEEEYEDALDTIDNIFAIAPNHPKALKCQVICLIYANELERALEIASAEGFKFETAYCCYRLNQLSKALGLLDAIEEPSTREKQLLAQVQYRLDNFAGSAQLYEDILNHGEYEENDVDEAEIRSNLVAAYAQAGQSKEAASRAVNDCPKDEVNYELEFNRACALIGSNDYAGSFRALEESERLARAAMAEDDESSEDIEKEVAIIRVQLGVVEQMLGRSDAAKELYTAALKTGTKKQTAIAVASSNLIVLRKDHDMFDSYKRMKSVKEEKLSFAQKRTVAMNRALLLMSMGKEDELKRLYDANKDDGELNIVWAALMFRKYPKNTKKCVDVLQAYIKRSGDDDTEVQLALAQVHVLTGDLQGAIATLESIPAIKYTPGGTATLMALYERVGKVGAATKVMEDAVSHATDSAHRVALMSSGALEHMRQKRFEAAAKAFKGILDDAAKLGLDEDAVLVARAHYVSACAFVDAAEAVKTSNKHLPSVGKCTANLTTLESNASSSRVARSGSEADKNAGGNSSIGDINIDGKTEIVKKRNEKKIAQRRKLRRERYLAKMNAMDKYDEHNPIPQRDLERWIPRNMRKANRRRARRGEAHTSGGAQGAGFISEKDLKKLDAKARAEDNAKKLAQLKVVEDAAKKKKGGRRKKGKKGRRR